MKSTAEHAAKRRELKNLVTTLGELAWKQYPEIAACGIIARKNAPSNPSVIDYDEFFVLQHDTKTIPAKQTNGRVYLRFRRRVTRDRKHEALWHFWQPEYAATKPESVDELLPVVRMLVESFKSPQSSQGPSALT